MLQLQETHDQLDAIRAVDEELRREGVILAHARISRTGRTQNAELPTGLVLARRCAVRVEQVALVEHGVGDGTGPVPIRAHRDLLVSLGQQLGDGVVEVNRPRADL